MTKSDYRPQTGYSDTRFLTDKLVSRQMLDAEEYRLLLECDNTDEIRYLHEAARETAVRRFGNEIYIRGLLEFTNICRNDCLYCGIRRSNRKPARYCLSIEDIMDCCRKGYSLGFKTFVLQGGELPDPCDMLIENICSAIRSEFPDCAITLSVGERNDESYRRFFDAGATRYLLRHETHNPEHYSRLHPSSMSLTRRLHCLDVLKSIGYQTGTGFMTGSPFQTIGNIVEDILFIQSFRPEMIGIGPYIPHKDTPLGKLCKPRRRAKCNGMIEPAGKTEGVSKIKQVRMIEPVSMTLRLISIFRLMFPDALIPATTALASLPVPQNVYNLFNSARQRESSDLLHDCSGRELGILAGANVVMPNISPENVRGIYSIYETKASSGAESAEGIQLLNDALEQIGYKISFSRGDYQTRELF